MATYQASSAAALESLLLNTVSEGDVIELASGTYTEIDLDGYVFTDFVTITSADGNYGAKVRHLDIGTSAYLKFTKIDFLRTVATTATLDKIIELRTVDHITIDDCKIRCTDPSNLKYVAIYVHGMYDPTNIVLSNSLIDNVDGLMLYSCDGLTVSNCEFMRCHLDANKYSSLQNVLFEYNYIHDFKQLSPDSHNDVVQLEGSSCANWIFRKNIFLVGDDEDSTADIQVFYCVEYPMDNLLIEDNIIYTHHANAIKVNSDSTNVIVRRNTVIYDPTDTQQTRAIIQSPGTVEDNISCNNVAGGISGSNVVLNVNNPADPYYFADHITNPLKGAGTTLADLVSIPGSPAEGKGAAAYLAELLGAPPSISGLTINLVSA